jgi:hypothetical protein
MSRKTRVAEAATSHVTYGDRLGPAALARTLHRLLDVNTGRVARGGRAVPICLWGPHGVGKTTLVEDVARARGWAFASLSPGQLEEMGDLHGLPVLRDGRTDYAPPSWVPREPGPGVLLLDDLNRADDRILRGLMGLLQTGGLVSWRLPPGWRIVATANPEGGDYSVTPMDPALVDRMLHFTLAFEARAWARWATSAGVDPRGIAFVTMFPELVTGDRTTPRALVRFFEALVDVRDLRGEEALVRTLAASTLDDVTVAAFLAFARGTEVDSLGPLDVLDAPDGDTLRQRLLPLFGEGGELRLDRVGTLCERLAVHLLRDDYAAGPRHGENLEQFLLHPGLPGDLRMGFHRRVSAGNAAAKGLLRRKAIARLVLDAL